MSMSRLSRREVMNPGSMPAVAWSLASVEQTDLGDEAETCKTIQTVHTLVGRYLGKCGIRTCHESE